MNCLPWKPDHLSRDLQNTAAQTSVIPACLSLETSDGDRRITRSVWASLNTTVNINRRYLQLRWKVRTGTQGCPLPSTCTLGHLQTWTHSTHACARAHSYFLHIGRYWRRETGSLISFYGCVIGNINWKVKPVTSLEEKRQGDPLAEISPQNSYRTFVRH